MKILNRKKIISNATSEIFQKLRKDSIAILESALEAVDPEKTIKKKVTVNGDQLTIESDIFDLKNVERIFVIGGGKAGPAMAKAVESILGERITNGLLNVLKGTEAKTKLKHIQLNGAAHPIPDSSGVIGVHKMLDLIEGCNEKDIVIILISGGGSALLPCPAEGISLSDIQLVTSQLLKKGATINELNAIRKHLDSLKGGQLAKRCYPAQVISIIISDVVGDPIDTIASGPSAPDSSTFNICMEVLEKYSLLETIPQSVKERIRKGVKGQIRETPKESDVVFKKVKNYIIANNSIAAEAAAKKAEETGYHTLILSSMIEGEAKYVGGFYSGIAREMCVHSHPVRSPGAVISGGETTVEVKGTGLGGRNQEVVLGALKRISTLPCLIASLATDGIDGPTTSAGAIADGMTFSRAEKRKINPDTYLNNNDSFEFFNRLGDHIITGPTGTNVNDLTLILTDGS